MRRCSPSYAYRRFAKVQSAICGRITGNSEVIHLDEKRPTRLRAGIGSWPAAAEAAGMSRQRDFTA